MLNNLRRFKAGIFQALAHPTRIAIIELLRDEGEVPVSRIYEQLGLEQANASQHLAVLRSRQIVMGRKDGNQVFYSLRDRILGRVLDLMRQYFQAHLNEALGLLRNMSTAQPPSRGAGSSVPPVKPSWVMYANPTSRAQYHCCLRVSEQPEARLTKGTLESASVQLTVRDVSRFLNVSESTVERWIKQRALPAQYVGG